MDYLKIQEKNYNVMNFRNFYEPLGAHQYLVKSPDLKSSSLQALLIYSVDDWLACFVHVI